MTVVSGWRYIFIQLINFLIKDAHSGLNSKKTEQPVWWINTSVVKVFELCHSESGLEWSENSLPLFLF